MSMLGIKTNLYQGIVLLRFQTSSCEPSESLLQFLRSPWFQQYPQCLGVRNIARPS